MKAKFNRSKLFRQETAIAYVDDWESSVCRFPHRLEGWAELPPVIIPEPCLRNTYEDDYTSLIGRISADDSIAKVTELSKWFSLDFDKAAKQLRPEAWRFLYYCGDFTLAHLSSPRFNAEQALRNICDSPYSLTSDPFCWLESELTIPDLAAETEIVIRFLGINGALAAWAVLSLAQRLNLTKTEVVACTWWDPRWIAALAHSLKQATRSSDLGNENPSLGDL